MKKKDRKCKFIVFVLLMIIAAGALPACAWAATFEFDSSGMTKNSYNPRGYAVEINGQVVWLSSRFNNNGSIPLYTGGYSGIDYIDAEEAGTLYALTDRNPTPGKSFLAGYKDGNRISGFSSMIGTPSSGAGLITNGNSSGWKIPIHIKWEPGCSYEFAFYRGMRANNGITLVFSADGKGYIWYNGSVTAAEQSRYDQYKYDEYQFIVSYEKNTDPETGENSYFNFYMVPMRFTVQTYADISAWEPVVQEAISFYNSITERDLQAGKYSRDNVVALGQMIEKLDYEAKNSVRTKLQPEADARLAEMIKQLRDMIEKTKSEKPEPADMERLKELIEEGDALYAKASVNTGIDIGQYGAAEVELLGQELNEAKELNEYMEQGVIDMAADELEAAILAVRKSLRLEEQLYFYDKATGICVIAPIGSLPEDAVFYVRRMDKETSEFKAIEGQLKDEETEAIYYSIQFYQDEFQIQPTDTVEVQVPIDSRISQASSSMYFVSEDGELQPIDTVRAEGMHIFKTDVISDMVLAGSLATEEEKAAQRGEEMQNIIDRTSGPQDSDTEEIELVKEERKKEEYKDPLDKILKRNENTATFSNDVRRETDPVYLLYVAVGLAVVAAALGIGGVRSIRKERSSSDITS